MITTSREIVQFGFEWYRKGHVLCLPKDPILNPVNVHPDFFENNSLYHTDGRIVEDVMKFLSPISAKEAAEKGKWGLILRTNEEGDTCFGNCSRDDEFFELTEDVIFPYIVCFCHDGQGSAMGYDVENIGSDAYAESMEDVIKDAMVLLQREYVPKGNPYSEFEDFLEVKDKSDNKTCFSLNIPTVWSTEVNVFEDYYNGGTECDIQHCYEGALNLNKVMSILQDLRPEAPSDTKAEQTKLVS